MQTVHGRGRVTRRSILEDALKAREMIMQMVSKNQRGLEALEGEEDSFDQAAEECRILRELIRALEYEKVKAAIAECLGKEEEPREWQREVMEGKRQTGLFVLKGGADYRMVPPEE